MLFKVFHHREGNFSVAERPAHWPHENWQHVANVECDHIEHVFTLTNHIDQDWTTNPGVEKVGDDRHRSTSMGDIVESDGKFYICEALGWTEIEPLQANFTEDFELEARRHTARMEGNTSVNPDT